MATLKFLTLFFLLAVVSARTTIKINRLVPAAGRVIGGQESDISRRPYMASLQFQLGPLIFHNCGASIISTKFLLTAAHCNPGANLRNLFARVGSTSHITGGQLYNVTKFVAHPAYDYRSLDNDFGIASFDDGVEIVLGPNVAIIPLTETQNPADNSLLILAGWGKTKDTAEDLPERLREVQLAVVNQQRCLGIYDTLTERQICLGGTPQGDANPCSGDSGGPAVQNGIQYGITSGVSILGCEAPNMPSVFARVSSGRQWIRSISGV